MKKFRIENLVIITLILFLIIFILSFLIGPLFTLLNAGIFGKPAELPKTISDILGSKFIMQSVFNTILMAFLTVITVNVLGIFQLLVTRIYNLKYSKIFELIFSISLVCNGIIIVIGYLFLFGSNGVINIALHNIFPTMNLNWFQGWFPILLVHTFSFAILHLLFVGDTIKMIDNSIIEDARSLGASNKQILFKVLLPLIKPTLITSTVFIFLFSIGSNAAPTFLGGKLFTMINPTIRDLNSIGEKQTAILLSIFLGLITIIVYFVFAMQQRRKKVFSLSKVARPYIKMELRNNRIKTIFYILAIVISVIYILPLLTSIVFSFTSIETIYTKRWTGGFTLSNYIRLFESTSILKPIFNSIFLSFSASITSLCIGLSVVLLNKKYRNILTKVLENIFTLVWMTPSIILAIGVSSMYSLQLPFNIEVDKSILLPAAYVITTVYIVVYTTKAALKNVGDNIIEAATALSSNKFDLVARILLPTLFPHIISSGVVCFNLLLTEYTVSEILYTYRNYPISVFFRSELTNPSAYQMANILIYTTIIILISFTLFFIQFYIKNSYNKKIIGA